MNYCSEFSIQIALAKYYSPRKFTMVPNVDSILYHEVDLLVVNHKSLYATEIEIKISKADLVRDSKKSHHHLDPRNRIKYFYYAFPYEMKNCADIISFGTGIYLIDDHGRVYVERKAQAIPGSMKFTHEEAYKLARLASLRMWDMLYKKFDVKESED